ncbi:MAG: hypothetical protein AABZ39_11750 [Spirochaetota bacterium]
MPKPIPKKTASFGGVSVSHFSPEPAPGTPRALNVVLSFEEALKLQIGLQQLLLQLNSYNRATTQGRNAAVNICIYKDKKRITINEGKIRAGS